MKCSRTSIFPVFHSGDDLVFVSAEHLESY
jgi:hypothetical protein